LAAAAFSDGLNNNEPGQIHLSRDSGRTWETPLETRRKLNQYRQFWLAIASSSDGSKLVAVNAGGSIYTSKDSGSTWSLTSAANESWFSVASSKSGEKLVAVANAGPISISTNSGRTWNTVTNAPIAGWASVTSSSDGSKLAAVQWGGQIYISVDGGETWLQHNVPNTFLAGGIWGIAMSNDGNKIIAAGDGPYGGPVYILQPLPMLNIERGGFRKAGITISWPASATGFVLQQSSNLTTSNWMDVTNAPRTLNGQNQAGISSPVGIQFFRLRFPTGNPPLWWPFSPLPIIIL
jgi:hypothetical protein